MCRFPRRPGGQAMKRPRERKNEGRGFSPRPSSQLVKKVPYGAFLTALPRRAFWPNTKCCFRKALVFKAFRAAGYWIREQRFAAAGGRYRQSAVSAAAPLAGRHEVGPGMALRQGEQGALPPRAPLLLCPLTFQRAFLLPVCLSPGFPGPRSGGGLWKRRSCPSGKSAGARLARLRRSPRSPGGRRRSPPGRSPGN